MHRPVPGTDQLLDFVFSIIHQYGNLRVYNPYRSPIVKDLGILTPDEIRSIRKNLGLTQVQAGKLLGGGPRAFAKYESGTVRPAASVVTLLRLLQANPKMVKSIDGHRGNPVATTEVGPFEVANKHVAVLDARDLARLLDRLLRSEAHTHALPNPDIHVAGNIDARDGGEDGRITWEGGPERTEMLPRRMCQFQLKSGDLRPSTIGAEVLTPSGVIKPMVRTFLKAGGCYIMLFSRAYSRESVENREAALRDALRGAGLDVPDDQIVVYDAKRTADWTNRHPSVAAWLKEMRQPGTLGPFRSWNDLSRRSVHVASPFVEDERLPPYRVFLHEQVATPRRVARVVGLAGVGKSRLTLEALGPLNDVEVTGLAPSDLVLYADESEAGTEAVIRSVGVLVSGGQRAIVVVDSCPPKTHRVLQDMVLRTESRLSLVTLDDEIPSTLSGRDMYTLPQAPSSVTESIIDRQSPRLASEDRRRIAQFSDGFPLVAMLVAKAWEEDRPVAHATDDDLVDAFVLGRNPRDEEPLLRSAELLATFGLLGVDHQNCGALGEVAARGRDLSTDDLHVHIQRLIGRGVAQRRGRAAILQPPPIAMKLAERQWCDWRRAQWDDVLAGRGDPALKVLAAQRLRWLNTTPVARKVATHVCRYDGPFDGIEGIAAPGNASVLSYLAEIEHDAVAEQIERSLGAIEDLSTISGEVQGGLVAALRKIAFHPVGFDSGARLLLRLAAAWGNAYRGDARSHLRSLFPARLGNTEADGDTRLSFLREFSGTKDRAERSVLVEVLAEGSAPGRHTYRFVGPETHGSRPAMESWRPATRDEFSAYITGCVDLLVQFAMCEDAAGLEARRSLGNGLRGLVARGFIDVVEDVVGRVGAVAVPWPEALEGLNHVLIYDASSTDGEALARVRALIDALTPQGLVARVRLLVTEMPWDYLDDGSRDFGARDDRQLEAVRSLAEDLIGAPNVLAGVLPDISRGSQRMAAVLGRTLAERHPRPMDWLGPMVSAVLDTLEEERNFALLSGFLHGLTSVDPDSVEAFKRDMARSPDLAPALPRICWEIGISSGDVELAIRALVDGVLPAWHLRCWSTGRSLEDVPSQSVGPLVDGLLAHKATGVDVAVLIVRMYGHGAQSRLEGLRPQIRSVAEEFTRWDRGERYSSAVHHFIELMKWILGKGREDDDACATALTLARAVVVNENHSTEQCLMELLPMLLEGFPEIVWPIISPEIVSADGRPWRMEHLLGARPSRDGGTTPTILCLPEQALSAWCHAHPDQAPAFVAASVPILTSYDTSESHGSLHPVVLRLLDEFGDIEDVQQSLLRNIQSFSWRGSTTEYFALHEAPLSKLRDEHQRPTVRRWARKALRSLEESSEATKRFHEEIRACWEI